MSLVLKERSFAPSRPRPVRQPTRRQFAAAKQRPVKWSTRRGTPCKGGREFPERAKRRGEPAEEANCPPESHPFSRSFARAPLALSHAKCPLLVNHPRCSQMIRCNSILVISCRESRVACSDSRNAAVNSFPEIMIGCSCQSPHGRSGLSNFITEHSCSRALRAHYILTASLRWPQRGQRSMGRLRAKA